MNERNLAAGHGFHFLLESASDHDPIFLDVLGAPPRVGSFGSALSRARRIPCDWGRVATIGIRDLVEMKKTQRLEDYPVIGRLVLCHMKELAGCAAEDDLRWALENLFTLDELAAFLALHPEAVRLMPPDDQDVRRRLAGCMAAGDEPSDTLASEVRAELQARIALCQDADRRYWRAIIAELRAMRASGGLMPESSPV